MLPAEPSPGDIEKTSIKGLPGYFTALEGAVEERGVELLSLSSRSFTPRDKEKVLELVKLKVNLRESLSSWLLAGSGDCVDDGKLFEDHFSHQLPPFKRCFLGLPPRG
jgi:hypothetical protein